jgi:hypothetical protein
MSPYNVFKSIVGTIRRDLMREARRTLAREVDEAGYAAEWPQLSNTVRLALSYTMETEFGLPIRDAVLYSIFARGEDGTPAPPRTDADFDHIASEVRDRIGPQAVPRMVEWTKPHVLEMAEVRRSQK